MAQKRKRGGKTRWIGRYRDPAGTERSRTFDTKRDATAWEAEREREMRRGEWIDPETAKITVEDLVGDAINSTDKPSTKAGREHLKANLGDLAGMPASRVKPTHIKEWRQTLTTGRPWAKGKALADSTVNTLTAILHGVFTRAMIDDIVVRHPMRGVKSPQTGKSVLRSDIPTRDDVYALIDAAKSSTRGKPANKQMARIIQLAADTGLRAGEIAGLRVRSIDFLRRELHVHEQINRGDGKYAPLKTAASNRSIPLDDRTLEILSQQLQGRDCSPEDPVFRTIQGTPFHSGSIGSHFRAVAERAGIETTFHGLRHHYVSILIDAGLNPVLIANLVGHASPKVTLEVYAHIFPSAEASVRKALRDALRDQRGTEGESKSAN